MGSEQKNAFLAISLSALILFGWQFYFAPKKPANAPTEALVSTPIKVAGKTDSTSVGGPIEPTAAVASTFLLIEAKFLFLLTTIYPLMTSKILRQLSSLKILLVQRNH